jgi:hypothetical protein
MFDFDRWQVWLAERANNLQEASAEFNLGRPSSKPGCAFNIRTSTALSQIRIWNTGEADYEVMNLNSNDFIVQISGLCLDDKSFEPAFEEFVRKALGTLQN